MEKILIRSLYKKVCVKGFRNWFVSLLSTALYCHCFNHQKNSYSILHVHPFKVIFEMDLSNGIIRGKAFAGYATVSCSKIQLASAMSSASLEAMLMVVSEMMCAWCWLMLSIRINPFAIPAENERPVFLFR